MWIFKKRMSTISVIRREGKHTVHKLKWNNQEKRKFGGKIWKKTEKDKETKKMIKRMQRRRRPLQTILSPRRRREREREKRKK